MAAASRPSPEGATDCGLSPSQFLVLPNAKPTRLLLRTSLEMPDFVFEGLPSYDEKGRYTGPLPSAKELRGMFHQPAEGPRLTLPRVPGARWLGSAPLLPTATGGGKPFHNGGGLCSPGKWPHHAKSYADGAS